MTSLLTKWIAIGISGGFLAAVVVLLLATAKSKDKPVYRILRGVTVTLGLLDGSALLLVLVLGVRGDTSALPPWHFFWDMKYQPKYKPQGESAFFADGRSMRTPPANTVAYAGSDYYTDAGWLGDPDPHFLAADDGLYRGRAIPPEKTIDELDAAGKPTGTKVLAPNWLIGYPKGIQLDAALLRRGREVYNITCVNCHGPTGAGNGITTQYGMVGVANYHQEKYRRMPEGEIYHVIAYGRNTMMPYGHLLKVEDRWAVVAYVRALQRAQLSRASDLSAAQRERLENP